MVLTGCFLKGGQKDEDYDPLGRTVLQISVVSKGYGHAFAENLIEAYNKKQDKTVAKLIYAGPNGAYQDQRLQLPNNQVDLIFAINNTVFSTQVNSTLTNHWADLSDVYNAPLEGYQESDGTKTYADYLDKSFVDGFTFTDGKQYSVPFTSGVVGFLCNKTKWDATNANLRNAGKAEMQLPKTTTEMFDLFDRIKTQEVKNASGGTYAFSFSGINSYMHFMFNALWPQYLGQTAAENFFKGQDENGIYTPEIYRTDARLYSYDTVRKMILASKGYTNSVDMGITYDQEQLNFLRGDSFFSCNGDWMENEASKLFNPGEADVILLRTPIISEIVKNPEISADFTGSDARKDEKLSNIISFIDEHYIDADEEPTEAHASSLSISLNTLKFIKHARLVRHSLLDFIGLVPDNSTEIDEAKDFLKFMLSKEGQEIVMESTYGCAAPMTIDYSQMDYYRYGTYFTRSRLDIIKKSIPYGNAMNYPMEYLGNCTPCLDLEIATAFGGNNPVTANTLMTQEYEKYAQTWNDKMKAAGVSN